MKVTLQIDDDVYEAAERLAVVENRSVGEVLSDLGACAVEPSPASEISRLTSPFP